MVSDHRNIVNIKSHDFFGFPVHIKGMFTLCCIKCAKALCLKCNVHNLILKCFIAKKKKANHHLSCNFFVVVTSKITDHQNKYNNEKVLNVAKITKM